MNVKPLILIRAPYGSMSGAYRRLYEVFKRGKLEGISYIIVTDPVSYRNYLKMFVDFEKILQQYEVYILKTCKTCAAIT